MKHFTRFAHPTYQLILMFLSLFCVGFITKNKLDKFYSTDKTPTVLPNQDKKTIRSGFYLKNFLEFDVIANKFILDGVVWFEGVDGIEKYLDKFSVGKGSLLYKSDAIIETINNKKIYRYEVKIEFPANLTYKYFPLSDHVISFVISNPYLAEKGYNLEAQEDDFQVSPTLYVDGWVLSAKKVDSGVELVPVFGVKGKNSRLVFSLDFSQTSRRVFILILFPLIVGLFLSLFAFSIDFSRFSSILSLSTAAITSIIGYRFVIESMSPKVSYFMFSDIIFLLILIFTCIAFCCNSFYREKINPFVDWLVLSMYSSFIVMWYAVLSWWF